MVEKLVGSAAVVEGIKRSKRAGICCRRRLGGEGFAKVKVLEVSWKRSGGQEAEVGNKGVRKELSNG